jgi:hypothetical protein
LLEDGGVVRPQPDYEPIGSSHALVHREGEADGGGFPRLLAAIPSVTGVIAAIPAVQEQVQQWT